MEHFQTDKDTAGRTEYGKMKYSTQSDIKGGLMATSWALRRLPKFVRILTCLVYYTVFIAWRDLKLFQRQQ